MEQRWELSGDRTKLYFELQAPGFPAISGEYDAEAVDDFIANLSAMRGEMLPAVPMSDPDPGTLVQAAKNGRFWVHEDHKNERLILALLHPCLRWVAMRFDYTQARAFANMILRCLPPHQSQ